MSNLSPEPILDVTSWTVVGPEQMGKKRKRWLEEPGGQRWLFKEPRSDDQMGIRGEDWAEWVCAWLAGQLQVPCPEARLARYERRRGVVVRSFKSEGQQLIHGSEIMAGHINGYDTLVKGRNENYRPEGVVAALNAEAALRGAGEFGAADEWLSMLVFDALVANTDRHHDNWGVIESVQGREMAPAFDHGTALGMQVPDSQRTTLVEQAGVGRWCAKGRARTFAGAPKLMTLAATGFELMTAECRDSWGSRLSVLDSSALESRLRGAPSEIMSEAARRFAVEIVRVNRRRLLDVCLRRG